MQKKNDKRLILIELNEVNFDLALSYAKDNGLVNLRRVLEGGVHRTQSEARYEELEPWIQWVSAHTGKTAAQHGVFRLGDIVGSDIPQYFEQVEAAGYSVGSISAMNAENRLKKPAYFIPDPWTSTPPDGSFWSERLSSAISQAVNDNARRRVSIGSLLSLLAGLIVFARVKNLFYYLKLASQSFSGAWRKALFLDLFLHDLHLAWFRKRRPNFSTLFLNAGAHIQHHYLLNAQKVVKPELSNPDWYVRSHIDPFEEMLCVYDRILGDYLVMEDVDLVVATGLTQRPYDRVKYYWRLKDHGAFLSKLGVRFNVVRPLMTRDFVVEFGSGEEVATAARVLSSVVSEETGEKMFSEIDERELSLFITLTYSGSIGDALIVKTEGQRFDIAPHLAFVAIKNGMHDAQGYVYYKGRAIDYAASDGVHVKEIYNVVTAYFGLQDIHAANQTAPTNVGVAAVETELML